MFHFYILSCFTFLTFFILTLVSNENVILVEVECKYLKFQQGLEFVNVFLIFAGVIILQIFISVFYIYAMLKLSANQH